MFEYNIRDMKRACLRLTAGGKRPPKEVGILRQHADFLGLQYWRNIRVPKNPEHSKVPAGSLTAHRPGRLPRGKPYGPIVAVDFLELFSKVREAKGVDHPEYDPSRQGNHQAADH